MGMRMNNINMVTKVKKEALLKTLHGNLEQHSRIVAEARDGYVAKAKAALEKRLDELRQGKITDLSFQLAVPEDYSEVYKSTIKMLEWTTEDVIELQADEFRQLVEDKWDWTYGFYATNAAYSSTASRLAR